MNEALREQEALRMTFRFTQGRHGHRDIIIGLGSLEMVAACFDDCQKDVERDLQIAHKALSEYASLIKQRDALVAALEAAKGWLWSNVDAMSDPALPIILTDIDDALRVGKGGG